MPTASLPPRILWEIQILRPHSRWEPASLCNQRPSGESHNKVWEALLDTISRASSQAWAPTAHHGGWFNNAPFWLPSSATALLSPANASCTCNRCRHMAKIRRHESSKQTLTSRDQSCWGRRQQLRQAFAGKRGGWVKEGELGEWKERPKEG